MQKKSTSVSKRFLAVLMAVVMMLSIVPLTQIGCGNIFATKASAVSYPMCLPENYDIEASVGEAVKLVYSYLPAFKNEKLITKVYDENGYPVASAERQSYNSSSYPSNYTITWDTEDCEPGSYTVEMSYEFYSYYQWNEAPRTTKTYVILKDNINKGAKDKNKYSGSKEYFKNLSNKNATLESNELCTAASAWQNNNIKSGKYTIQLLEMYIGDKAETAVKKESGSNVYSDSSDQWILMSYKVKNNSNKSIDISDVLYLNKFYKYTGTEATVFASASISNKKNDVFSDDIEPGETKVIWIGLLMPFTSGMPYLRVKNGNGYTYLNTNPDLLTGKKKAGHVFSSWKVTKKATTTANGEKTRRCSVCGKEEKQVIARLAPKAISKLSFSAVTNKVYAGKAIKPSVTVKDGSKTLKAGTHYTVSYKNNTAIGKATITIKGIEKSGYSGTKNITFKIIPATPTLKVTAGMRKAKLSWNKVSGASGFEVYMSSSKGGTYKKVATVTNKTSYTKTGISKGKICYFKIRAFKNVSGTGYYSGYSTVKSVTVR